MELKYLIEQLQNLQSDFDFAELELKKLQCKSDEIRNRAFHLANQVREIIGDRILYHNGKIIYSACEPLGTMKLWVGIEPCHSLSDFQPEPQNGKVDFFS